MKICVILSFSLAETVGTVDMIDLKLIGSKISYGCSDTVQVFVLVYAVATSRVKIFPHYVLTMKFSHALA